MKIRWLPIFGAVVAVVLVKVVGFGYGMTASLVVLGVLVAGWIIAHFYYKRRIRQLHSQLCAMGESDRAHVLAQFDPEIRKDIEAIARESSHVPRE